MLKKFSEIDQRAMQIRVKRIELNMEKEYIIVEVVYGYGFGGGSYDIGTEEIRLSADSISPNLFIENFDTKVEQVINNLKPALIEKFREQAKNLSKEDTTKLVGEEIDKAKFDFIRQEKGTIMKALMADLLNSQAMKFLLERTLRRG